MTTIYTVKTFGTPAIRPYTGPSREKALLSAINCKGSGSCTTAEVVSGPSRKALAEVSMGEELPSGCVRIHRL